MSARNPIPSMAAAIAYVDLSGRRNGWADPAALWGDLPMEHRAEYRAMARAALEAARQANAITLAEKE